MACGNNQPQQQNTTQPVTYGNQTADGSPPMSLVGGGTNAIPMQGQMMQASMSQPQSVPAPLQPPMAPQQMAQQAAAMPTATTAIPPKINPNFINKDGSIVNDGIGNDGTYNPKYDQTIQQISGRMKAMQDSGAFLTPAQRAQQAHPILMGLANAAKTFGQGITKQPFMTSPAESEAGLENTQSQNAAQLMSPTNMMNMMLMKSIMLNGGVPAGTGNMSGNNRTPLTPAQLQALNANAPKGATHFSPTVGYTDAQGNPVK